MHNLGNVVSLNSVYLHITWKVHMDCDLKLLSNMKTSQGHRLSCTLEKW